MLCVELEQALVLTPPECVSCRASSLVCVFATGAEEFFLWTSPGLWSVVRR